MQLIPRLALALVTVLAPACSSLSDYLPQYELQGRHADGRYVAPNGAWSVDLPGERLNSEHHFWGARTHDTLSGSTQITVEGHWPDARQHWSVDVIDRREPAPVPLDAQFVNGWFEWLGTSGANDNPRALAVVDHSATSFDGLPARVVRTLSPFTNSSAPRQGRLGLLVDRDPYWVACLVAFEVAPAAKGAPEPDLTALRPELDALARSFRVEPAAAAPVKQP